MNSYPPELLLQHAPLMFAAGLEAFAAAPSSPSQPNGDKVLSPDLDSGFPLLAQRLRTALSAPKKPMVWDPERAKDFDVILVDKNVRFPPRKIIPPAPAPQPPDGVAHSPLSPLTPTSPLYPDGLIAPIWVRKHTTLIPSVFVLFLRLWESKKEVEEEAEKDSERIRESEREKDAELAKEIAERKRSTAERGIKLTVVLLASRAMLDDANLDARLSALRRAASLDSRAALFVLSPVVPSELAEFVASLQKALHPVSLAYYANHSKSTRRKRSRPHAHHANGPVSLLPHHGPPPGVPPRPLRPEGWAVRYEYKMGVFAEFRGEVELARKHFEDCWSALLDMFSSTAILPPRTKRWAEAKVLADSVSFKIVKLHLYLSMPAAAVRQFRSHLARFTDLSRGWGMGEETVEFWGWAARQYRLLSELLETAQAHAHPLILPTLLPSQSTDLSHNHYPQLAQAGQPPPPMPGMNPSDALVGPAYWYLCAAECTRERRKRWLGLLEHAGEDGRAQPNFQTEKKVDHQAVIRELYTKAYELFKKHSAGPDQSRLPFYVAFRVAEAYYDAGEWEMAVRFFERTAKLYRREQWGALLLPILRMWHQCLKRLGDIEAAVRLTLELMAAGEDGLEEDLLAMFKTTSPSTSDPAVLELPDSEPLFYSSVAFWKTQLFPSELASFQLLISAPASLSLSLLPISQLRIHFDDDRPPSIVQHRLPDPQSSDGTIECVDIDVGGAGSSEIFANLRWQPSEVKVFRGSWTSSVPGELRISSVVFCLAEGGWSIELPFDPNVPRSGSPWSSRWLCSTSDGPQFISFSDEQHSFCKVIARPHEFHVSISHDAPAYLEERYPITVEVANLEERELDVLVDVLLQPSEDEDVNQILMDDQQSSGFINGISFGLVKGGETTSKILWLVSTGSTMDRTLDVSVQTRTIEPNAPVSTSANETLRTVGVPVISPVVCTYATVYRLRNLAAPLLTETGYVDQYEVATTMEATLSATLACAGPWSIITRAVRFIQADLSIAQLKSCSLDDDDAWPMVWEGADVFHTTFDFALPLRAEEDAYVGVSDRAPSSGHLMIAWQRRHPLSNLEHNCITRIPLPSLLAPSDGVVGVLSSRPVAYLHAAFNWRLTVHNFHPTEAVGITVQAGSSEFFAVQGPRQGRATPLKPRSFIQMAFKVYPLVLGAMTLPVISVSSRRLPVVPEADADGSEDNMPEGRRSIESVTRIEQLDGDSKAVPLLVADPADPERAALEFPSDGISVLVVPYTQA